MDGNETVWVKVPQLLLDMQELSKTALINKQRENNRLAEGLFNDTISAMKKHAASTGQSSFCAPYGNSEIYDVVIQRLRDEGFGVTIENGSYVISWEVIRRET